MITQEQWTLVEKYINADTNKLRLAHHGNDSMTDVIDQIDCRQRTASKLKLTLQQAPHFIFPSVLSAEQSTSDFLAEYHASALCKCHEMKVLDMTCGLGIDAFHIAKQAKSVTAIEITPHTCICAKHNAAELGLHNFTAICGDSSEVINTFHDDEFDCIFIDPARRGEHGQRLFSLNDCKPNVTTLLPRMLRIAPRVVIKASPMLDITHTINELKNVSHIYVIGNKQECKELVVICEREKSNTPITINAVTIDNDGSIASEFCFSIEDEASSSAIYTEPISGDFIHIPYPASIKTGAFRILSSRFNTAACAPNSHLFISKNQLPDFPGLSLEIIDVFPFNKKGIKALVSQYKTLNITTRNFPLSPDNLAKKLKIKQGGDMRLFATRTANDSLIMILTKQ